MTTTHKTFCRNCGAQCGLELKVLDNKIIQIRGDRDNPISKGYMCIKGLSSQELQNGSGRLGQSLKRDHEGRQQFIGTLHAVDEIGDRLKQLLERHGPRSIAMYYGTGAYQASLGFSMSKSWLRAVGSPHLYSTQTIDQSPKVVTALRMGAFESGRQLFAESDVWLFCGTNPLVSHFGGWGANTMYAPGTDIRAAKKRGMQLIVVDPRRTEAAELADIHLQVKPGQDVAVFAGMLRMIIHNGWHDREFCERHVRNLDALNIAVARYTPEYAAEQAGVSLDNLKAATETFAKAHRGCASSGTGTNMAPHANLAEHLLECLNAVCGRYRRAGERILNVGLFAETILREAAMPPFALWEHSPRMASHPEAGYPVPDEFPTNLLADEICHEGPERIRALIVNAGNPALSVPGHQAVMNALRHLDLLVTLDIRRTATTDLSHYVVACKTPYERPDVSVLTERNSPFAAAQYTDAVVQSPAEAIEERDFFFRLGQRMGLKMDWNFSAFGVPGSSAPMPLDMTDPPSSEALFRTICRHPQIPFEKIRCRSGGQIFSVDELAVLPAADSCARLDLLPESVGDELNRCYASNQRQHLDADEFLLISRRMLEVLNSNYIDSEAARKRAPVNPLYMHPDDMNGKGLHSGAMVVVRSSTGALHTVVRPDGSMRRGTVAMHHAWGEPNFVASNTPSATPVAALIDREDCRESINYVPRMSAIPVTIRAIQ